MENIDKVYLREVQNKDNELFLDWLNDDRVLKYLNIKKPINADTQARWFRHLKKDESMQAFMICLVDGDRAIGSISLNKINYIDKNAELTIFIGDIKFRGRGFGTKAISLLVNYGFNKLGLHRIYTGAYDFNIASARSLIKAGFVQEGILRHAVFKEGRYCDTLMFGILK